ncbi:MAG: Ig-like domain-containing protein, partial [Planctomycetaceae bacterium]|nr:Ig-like domain-containing protein [Planctomycetaceae bacterium]
MLLRSWLTFLQRRITNCAASPSYRGRRRQHFDLSAMVEVLESRELLSVSSLVGLPHNDSRVSSTLVELSTNLSDAQQVADASAGQTSLLDLLTVDTEGRVGVRINAGNVTALLPSLADLGFVVQQSLPDRHLVEGFLPIASLGLIDSLAPAGLLGVMPIFRPLTSAGAVTSQADVVLETNRVRSSLPTGYDGSGLIVGVLSDSYDTSTSTTIHAANDIATGDLPAAGVNVLKEGPADSSDEGRAMLQLIHDLAPGAGLAFASAFFGEADFAQQIRDLADPTMGNADVIVDDVVYFAEPYFQDGIVAQAVDDVVLNRGVSYFSSAGNQSTNAWESTSVSFAADSGGFAGSFIDFNPGAGVDTRQLITLGNGQRFTPSLQWDDPFYTVNGVDTDLDVVLVIAGTTTIVAVSVDDNPSNQTPSELLSFTNSSGSTQQYELLIQRFSGPSPTRVKYVNFGSSGVISEFNTNSPTVSPHAAAVNGAGVAAAFYGDQTTPESFTSQGPTTILFQANGTRLLTPQVRQSVRFTATDGTDTTFFGGSDNDVSGFPNFFGTSAAAPHAAAVAALIKQANPGFTAAQIYDRMATTALDIGAAGYDNVTGAGLINAYDAVFGPAVPAGLNVADGFESAALSAAWETHSTGPGRILVTSANGPRTGTQHLTMDTFASFGLGLNEAILHVDTTGLTNIQLSFAQKESGDEDHAMSSSFVGSENSDGVAFSVDGVTWHRLVSLVGAASTAAWSTFSFNLSSAAASAGVVLGSDVQIKFQQYDNFPFTSDGFAFDDISVTGTAAGPPVVSNLSPGDDATNVPVASNLVITFDRAVAKGTGSILIRRFSDDTIAQTIAVTSGLVSVSGAVVTIDPADLDGHTGYYVTVDGTAFKDLSDNAFAGISNKTDWNFTTANALPVAQASSVTTNEDTAKTFAVSNFQFTDADGDPLASITVSDLSLAGGDTLTVDLGAGPVAVTNGMTITATQIASLTYTPAPNGNGSARSTFDFKVNDAGSGTVSATMSIHVTAVNDAPVRTAGSLAAITVDEDSANVTAVTLGLTGLTYAPGPASATDESAQALTYTLTTIPAFVQIFKADGTTQVTAGGTVTAAELVGLTYKTVANANGSGNLVLTVS